jgi:hypothetical protein
LTLASITRLTATSIFISLTPAGIIRGFIAEVLGCAILLVAPSRRQ